MMMVHWWRLRGGHLATLIAVAQAFPKIVSVPDLHGDYERTVQVLQAAGLIDPRTGAWSGGSTNLVQTGDIADRGPDTQKIYKLFARLAVEAAEQGGEVHNLLGNHEVMNLQGDYRYVNSHEIKTVGGTAQWHSLWKPDAEIGQQVRKFKVAVKVGPVLFVHAGLLPLFLKNGHSLEDVNRDVAAALSEDGRPHRKKPHSTPLQDLLGENGPTWTRFYDSSKHSEEVCNAVSQVLEKAGAQRMVVGHNIQERAKGEFRVSPVCGGRLILADTAVSSAYGGEMSYITYDSAGGEAVAHYPGLGTTEVLPPVPIPHSEPSARASATDEQSKPKVLPIIPPQARASGHHQLDDKTRSTNARFRVRFSQAKTSRNAIPAAVHPWLNIAEHAHSVIYLIVAFILVLSTLCYLRPWVQRRKSRPGPRLNAFGPGRLP